MNTFNDPGSVSVRQSIRQIRQYAASAEQTGQLTLEQLNLIHQHNWFNLYVPVSLGGLGLSLPESIRILELLAYADGSMGWTVTLCSGANWFVGFMDAFATKVFFSDNQICLAGSGTASGKAIVTEKGYLINGFWKYATGAAHATAFTANCILEKDGVQLTNEDGSPRIKTFIFTREEVEIHRGWNTTGMRATGSHSFQVTNLQVPGTRSFDIHPKKNTLPHLIYQFPFDAFSEVTIAANFCGMAYHFADECKKIFDERIKRHRYELEDACEMLENLGRAIGNLQNIRLKFYSALDKTWSLGKKEGRWDKEQLEDLRAVCKSLAKQSRNTVDDLYPYCGMIAANMESDINRIWRDFQTASLHAVFTFGCK